MMAGITFVTTQADRRADLCRKIQVELHQALVIALVPVVSAPASVGDVLKREAL